MDALLTPKTNRRRFLGQVSTSLGAFVVGCRPKPNKSTTTTEPISIKPQATRRKRNRQGIEHIGKIDDGRAHRSDASILSHNGLIHLLGGSIDWMWTFPTERYTTFNPDTLEWTHKEKMPQQLSQMTSFGLDGDIITVGGKKDDQNDFRSGELVNQILRYDTEKSKWNTLRNFPTGVIPPY